MPAAARVGDPTAHGSPLTPKDPATVSRNVFIGGQPAWRVGDVHVCPAANGPQPHVGGAVAVGSKTVLINKLGAVRQGDQLVEGGSVNAVAVGLTTVQVGG